jgi:hypothetical protein
MQAGDGLASNYRESSLKVAMARGAIKIFVSFTHISRKTPDIYYMSTTTLKHIKKGTVNHESWVAFLQSITRYTENGERLINGQVITSETHKRTLYRWEKEGASPVWWKVDQFLCPYGLIFTDLEIWCFCEKRELWEKDPPDNWA